MLTIDLISLFPSYFESPLNETILKQAQKKGFLSITAHDLRSYSKDKHKKADDRPFGGGPGMVMQPEPIWDALKAIGGEDGYVVYLSPQGEQLTPVLAKELAEQKHLVLLSGHYEGMDERVKPKIHREVSIGDYVLTNGCLASLVLLDAVIRFIPGVLGDFRSVEEDSFENGLLDYPHFTRPTHFKGEKVPPVLRGGNHEAIALWRQKEAFKRTFERRPDLFLQFFEKEEGKKREDCGKIGLFFFASDLKKVARFYTKIMGFSLIDSDESSIALKKEEIEVSFFRSEPFSSREMLQQLNVKQEEFKRILSNLKKQSGKSLLYEGEQACGLVDPAGNLWMVKVR